MMKKLFTLFLSAVMLLTACVSLIGCGGHTHTYGEWIKNETHHWKECTDAECNEKSDYGTHSFNNGACVCGAKTVTIKTVSSNIDESKSLNEVKAGTSDVAIVDEFIYKHYSTSRSICEGLSVLDIAGVESPVQQFRFITRKDSNIDDYFNAALYKLQEEGIRVEIRGEEKVWTLSELAAKYNLNDLLIEIPEPTVNLDDPIDPDSDLYTMLQAGIAKIHFADPSGKQWLEPLGWQTHAGVEGFMFYVAQAALKELGLNVYQSMIPGENADWSAIYQVNYTEDFTDFQIICGMITDDITYYDPLAEETVAITDMFDLSVPFMSNRQVLVTKAEKVATYNSLASLASATIVTEANFAGYAFANNQLKNAILGA